MFLKAISTQERQSPGMVNGKEVAARDRPPGIIFFNTDGDECGGLVYDGDKKSAGLVFSVDQYKQDQIMQLQYQQDAADRHYGLKIYDRPNNFTIGDLLNKIDSLKKLNNAPAYERGIEDLKKEGRIGADRMFVGKAADGDVGVFINDSKGTPRIKLYVDRTGKGKIEFLNGQGK
jgi:hypothetical protein